MQSLELSSKFDPFILNKATNPQLVQLRHQLDDIFEARLDPNRLYCGGFKPISAHKAHILTHPSLPGWIIKAPRNDQYHCREDQHIYRVRKMERVRQVIEAYNMTEVVAPKKFLYEFKGKWFVIAEKMDLNPEIKIDNVWWERQFPKHKLKPLTPKQAKEMAIICYETGLSDMGAHNLGYLKTGQVCPFDSEPLTRGIKKKWKRLPIPGIGIAVNFFLAKANADRLLKICHDPQARKEVEKVQKIMLLKHVAKLTCLAALPIIFAVGALTLPYAVLANSIFAIAVKAAFAASGINALSNLTLLGLSIFGEEYIGSFEYEGDLLDKYGR
jgi:hypothetical protein